MKVHNVSLTGQASPPLIAGNEVAEELPNQGYNAGDDLFVRIDGKTYWTNIVAVYPGCVAWEFDSVVVVFKRDLEACCAGA